MTYSEFVQRMLRDNERELHCFLGLSSEAGEVLDLYKKTRIYGNETTKQEFMDELGDVHFYFTGLLYLLGITQEEIEDNNRHKLTKRYDDGKCQRPKNKH